MNSSEKQNIIYYYFLFVKSGLCILEKNLERNNNLINNEDEYNKLRKIIQKLVIKIMNNQNNKNKEDLFLFNRFIINKYKIIIMIKSKIVSVGIFALKSSRGFQNLLLIHLYISLINFKGDSIIKLNLINNSNNTDCFSLQEFQEEKKDKIINNKIKVLTIMDVLEILIFQQYFLKYCIIHFENVFSVLTKKEDINLTFTKFLDLYIIDISSDTLLFDLNEITKNDLYYNYVYHQYYKNKNIFKEILFHSHQLYNSYISKYGTKFIKDDSSQRFIKVECTSTYPRVLFIIKFIPVLKGIIVIHIYYQNKLSRGNNNNVSINHENKYKEVDLVFGSFFGENGDLDLKYVMPKKLENIEKFMEEFFLTTRSNDFFKLNEPSKEFKYFNYNIIKIINSIPIDTNNTPFPKIFEHINEIIKTKYKEEQGKNHKKKKFKKFLYNNTITEESHDKNTITIKKVNKNDDINDSLEKLFLIDKNILYNDLFPNTIENIISIQNNLSTIKSNNKNIINILRESDSSIKNINFTRPKTNYIKEENNLVKSNTKTLNLMSESNLISKEDEIPNKDISQDFSLISAIKKNDNNNNININIDNSSLFKLKYAKKDNSNLKNLNLQELLNTSSTLKENAIKERIKHNEESVSDLINKEFNSNNNINITIKKRNNKAKRGKPRSKLVLLDDD